MKLKKDLQRKTRDNKRDMKHHVDTTSKHTARTETDADISMKNQKNQEAGADLSTEKTVEAETQETTVKKDTADSSLRDKYIMTEDQ